jgi:hypothetical protein
MIRAFASTAAAIALLLVSACANADPDVPNSPAAANPSRQCFFASSVNGFASVDSRTVNIRVGPSDVYRLDLTNSCRDVSWTNRMALVTRGGSSICPGAALGTSLVIRGPTGQQRCAVRSVTMLTPQQVEALRPRERP